MSQRADSLLVLLVALAAIGTLRAPAMERYYEAQTYEDLYVLPPPNWLVVASLGHRSAMADLVWMKALVYVGNEFSARGHVANIYRYTDAIVALDPDFRRVYSWVASAALYRPQEVSTNEQMRVLSYLREGVRRFPDDGRLAWELGATLMYELAPLTQGEQRDALRAEGLEHLAAATRLGAGHSWMVLSNASQLEALGRSDRAVAHLREMYATVQEESIRAEILARIEALQSAADAEALQNEVVALERRREEQWPWLPGEFFILLGERVREVTRTQE